MFEMPLGSARLLPSTAMFAMLLLVAMGLVATPAANAGPGYEPDPVQPSIALGAEGPTGIAIDQESQRIYVAELTTNTSMQSITHGQVEQLSASGVPTAQSPFVTGASDYFTGVAVNPVTHGIYAYQTELRDTPLGTFGAPLINTFSSTGVSGSSFTPSRAGAPQLAADSSGRVFYPSEFAGTLQVFDSVGTLKDTIACTGCPGGAFDQPKGVAVDAADNIYVVDIGNDRAIKFELSAGSYVYDSVLQSGEGAVAIAVDPASGDIFVGDFEKNDYHIVAYDSSGVQFDDFGAGVVGTPKAGAVGAGQIAVNATTHKVYVTDPSDAHVIRVFVRIPSIPAPTASTSAPSPLGQLEATLKASVNPKGHGLTDCHFEYTTDADLQEHGFANATSLPCSSSPGGPAATTVSAPLSGLTPATAYDYRIVVASNGGAAEGTAQKFTTLPPLPPLVTTGSATAITLTKATIKGSVNARGGPISNCHFKYTTDADFQKNGFANAISATCSPAKPNGTNDVAVSAPITGLTAGTSYRFRVLATNNSGTSEGLDQAFATEAETCATNQALCPPPPPPEEAPLPPLITQPPILTPTTPPAKKPLKCRKGFKKKRVRGKMKCVRIKRRPAQRRRQP